MRRQGWDGRVRSVREGEWERGFVLWLGVINGGGEGLGCDGGVGADVLGLVLGLDVNGGGGMEVWEGTAGGRRRV
ncbi:hypothetical protein GBA52_026779 [Prunus armeniaca]|nr:hypothetical protein GBA52_026779 [Prunus armeniaca]